MGQYPCSKLVSPSEGVIVCRYGLKLTPPQQASWHALAGRTGSSTTRMTRERILLIQTLARHSSTTQQRIRRRFSRRHCAVNHYTLATVSTVMSPLLYVDALIVSNETAQASCRCCNSFDVPAQYWWYWSWQRRTHAQSAGSTLPASSCGLVSALETANEGGEGGGLVLGVQLLVVGGVAAMSSWAC